MDSWGCISLIYPCPSWCVVHDVNVPVWMARSPVRCQATWTPPPTIGCFHGPPMRDKPKKMSPRGYRRWTHVRKLSWRDQKYQMCQNSSMRSLSDFRFPNCLKTDWWWVLLFVKSSNFICQGVGAFLRSTFVKGRPAEVPHQPTQRRRKPQCHQYPMDRSWHENTTLARSWVGNPLYEWCISAVTLHIWWQVLVIVFFWYFVIL